MSHINISIICRNIHIIRDGHIPVKEHAPLFGDIDRDAFLGQNVIRNMNITIASVESDTSAGNQFTVVLDDEVPGIRSLFVNVLASCHRNVADFRNRLAQNINGSKTGFQVNILIRRYRFLILHVIGADIDITLTCLYRYAFIPGFDRFCDNNAALAGNICNDVSGSGVDIAFQRNISIPLHIEACFVTRSKRSCTRCRAAFRLHTFRQSANVDTRLR